MAPKDPTPHGGEAFHELPDRAKIPQPKPGGKDKPLLAPGSHPAAEANPARSSTHRPDEGEIAQRPELPDSAPRMPGDTQPAPTQAERTDPERSEGEKELSTTHQPVR
jgi:hypothetical protein